MFFYYDKTNKIMHQFILLAIFSLIGATSADAPLWNGLRSTWSPNPFNGYGFDSLPRTVKETEKKEFLKKDDQCGIPNAKFLGSRYWYKNDSALILLFDQAGFVAGIQTSVPKSAYTPFPERKNRNYIEDGDYWTVTAYFVDPSTICNGGRSEQQFQVQGTGSGLWLQMGPNPVTDSVKIPVIEPEVRQTAWNFGKCFRTMGNHYWYNTSKEMNCNEFIPECLLYNKGKLTAFCFAMNVGLESRRYEHPTAKVFPKFLDPVPDCFSKDKSFAKLSTMHIYFIDNPRMGSWC